ncbi:MAG: hypothetical protein FD161_1718 [Limisphaerales bacterium]|nr:MAG: hypothetical protein FD161_1718 [Limisphaerales bacterium]KAG0509154.1 MAG: hypothetical protein E1N63_1637 [Limisphaerales bacterium]TXT52506.1 MAG: hypothetical protein FD140_730 [Limisphaerales bacterium]
MKETPKPKLQAPKKLQTPSSKEILLRSGLRLKFGAWGFFGAWSLGFGALVLAYLAHSAEFPAAWKNSQPLTLSQPGLVRFSVPLETLDAARPGLEDLRIHDAAAREIPFDLDRPVQRAVLTAAPRKFGSKIEGASTVVLLETGQAQPVVGVTLQTPARDFLKPVRVEGSSDGKLWATIVDGQPIFVLAGGATQLCVNFPAGLWPHLRVTLDDRRAAPIPITGATLHPETAESAPTEPLGLEITERAETDKETRLTLRLNGGNVTLAGLSLVTGDALFSRRVTLAQRTLSEGEVRETPLATAFLYRLALEGRPAVSNITFAVDVPVQSRELLLTIHNDDNPPLNLTTIEAKRRPVFAVLLNDRPGPLQLLSGNAQCAAPKYDLAALRRDLRTVPVVTAQAGALTANPKFTAPDPLAMLAAGTTPLDVNPWRFRKAVRLVGPGIQQLELDLETLARCAASFADLRVVAAGQQVPFILERTPIQRSFPVATSKADDPKRPKTSRWELALPHKSLPLTRLTCETGAPLFRREVTVFEERPDSRGEKHRVALGNATWVRTPEHKPGKLVIALNQPPTTDRLWLEMENGDNPPLELTAFTAWHTTARLLFRAADGSAPALYYGNIQVAFPRYDLDLVARQIFSAPKIQATLGPEEALKGKPLGESLAGTKGNALFWGVLVAVVAVLLFVLSRLLPKPAEPAK